MNKRKQIEKEVFSQFNDYIGNEKDVKKILKICPNDYDLDPADDIVSLMTYFGLEDDSSGDFNEYYETLSEALFNSSLGEMIDIIEKVWDDKKQGSSEDDRRTTEMHKYFIDEEIEIDDVAYLLYAEKKDLYVMDKNGNTPIFSALYAGNDHIVVFLMEACKMDPEKMINGAGLKLLHAAIFAKRRKLELVKGILKFKVNIDPVDSKGYTPLVYAIIEGEDEIVQLLLENGADKTISVNYPSEDNPITLFELAQLLSEEHSNDERFQKNIKSIIERISV